MSWHFDDKPLLTHLFGSFLPLSIDIQKVLLDYLFRREIISFDKNGVPSYLRLGPVLISNQIAYEIRAYNSNETHVFSTFETTESFGLSVIFNSFQARILHNHKIKWCEIFMQASGWFNFRYAFSPVTRWSYIIRNIGKKDEIVISRRSSDGWLYNIRYARTDDVQQKIIEACELIKKYGEELDDFPEWITFGEGVTMEKNESLRARKGEITL